MRKLFLVWAVLLCSAVPLYAQRPVWVLLKPEAVRSGTIVTGERERVVLENDRALPASLIKKIERTGARVRVTSRWLRAVSVAADAQALAKLRMLPEVGSTAPVALMSVQGSARRVLASAPPLSRSSAFADFDSVFYGANWKAIRQLGIPASHTLGFTGRNIRIAILDTGFEPGHESLVTRRVVARRDFINNDSVVTNELNDPAETSLLNQEVHGTQVWSILGGNLPGKLVGPAFDAEFLLAKVDANQFGDEDFAADEDRWVAAVEWAEAGGARIISSSLTFRDFVDKADYQLSQLDGNTALSTRMVDEAARRGVLVVNAIGNFGPEASSLWAPADADSVIAVGAVDSLGQPVQLPGGRSSGRGPTFNGRLKPELVALGKGLTAARSRDLNAYDTGLEGTSYATPLIAGVAAMFMQAWPSLTIMAVRSALILSATRADNPDNSVGFGVPNIASAILFPEGLQPVGVTSLNLQNELTTIQPIFTWSAPIQLRDSRIGPIKYTLQISTDPTFASVVYSDTTSTAFSLTVKRPLRPAPQLYWRVLAEAFPDIVRATRVSGPFSMPKWVRLTTLNDPRGSFTDDPRPLLRWDPLEAPPPSGPLTFDVQVMNAVTGVIVATVRNVTTASAQPPEPLAANVNYRWRVIARSQPGIADTTQSLGTFVVTSSTKPPVTLLYQNFPNPFPRIDLGENSTHIWFDVNSASPVELAVYDLRGRLVRQLIPGAASCGTVTLEAGQYGRGTSGETDPCVVTEWDGRNERGDVVARGVYVLRLRAGGTSQIKRIVYMPGTGP